jgi:hypothetical protein
MAQHGKKLYWCQNVCALSADMSLLEAAPVSTTTEDGFALMYGLCTIFQHNGPDELAPLLTKSVSAPAQRRSLVKISLISHDF